MFCVVFATMPHELRATPNWAGRRRYQRVSAALAAQQSRLRPNRTVSRAAYLYIVELGGNFLNCRIPGPRSGQIGVLVWRWHHLGACIASRDSARLDSRRWRCVIVSRWMKTCGMSTTKWA
jgi:hypothetical protein